MITLVPTRFNTFTSNKAFGKKSIPEQHLTQTKGVSFGCINNSNENDVKLEFPPNVNKKWVEFQSNNYKVLKKNHILTDDAFNYYIGSLAEILLEAFEKSDIDTYEMRPVRDKNTEYFYTLLNSVDFGSEYVNAPLKNLIKCVPYLSADQEPYTRKALGYIIKGIHIDSQGISPRIMFQEAMDTVERLNRRHGNDEEYDKLKKLIQTRQSQIK